jgi:hypothetical protein
LEFYEVVDGVSGIGGIAEDFKDLGEGFEGLWGVGRGLFVEDLGLFFFL